MLTTGDKVEAILMQTRLKKVDNEGKKTEEEQKEEEEENQVHSIKTYN